MTPEQQKQLVTDLCENMKASILTLIDQGKVPERWDGIELRWLLADAAKKNALSIADRKHRKREYNNHALVYNLP